VFILSNYPYWVEPFENYNGSVPGGMGLCDGQVCGITQFGGKYNTGNLFTIGVDYPRSFHTFKPSGKVGYNPWGDLAYSSSNHTTYGTNSSGGVGNFGTVYQLVPGNTENSWTVTVVHIFSGRDGDEPWAGVILDAAGNLYGTTQGGGQPTGYGQGTVFKLTPSRNKRNKVIWTLTTLYSFTGGADGGNVTSPVVLDSAGNVYGTTTSGGAYGQGVVYLVTP